MSERDEGNEKAVALSFRAGEASDDIKARGDHFNTIARRDLERYYALLRRTLTATRLTEAEATTLVQSLGGRRFHPDSIHLVWAQLLDGAAPGSAATELAERLRESPPATATALLDAVERFRRLPETTPWRERLIAVGLHTGGRQDEQEGKDDGHD